MGLFSLQPKLLLGCAEGLPSCATVNNGQDLPGSRLDLPLGSSFCGWLLPST